MSLQLHSSIDKECSQRKHNKHHFSVDEDRHLLQLVQVFGENNWNIIAHHMPNRSVRQCRERYIGYLCPSITNAPWTDEEDRLLISKYMEYGPKWTFLAAFFRGRSDQNLKNRFHKHLKKNLSMLNGNRDPQKSELQNDAALLTTVEFSDFIPEPDTQIAEFNSSFFGVDDIEYTTFLL